jgi:hypothetical protein
MAQGEIGVTLPAPCKFFEFMCLIVSPQLCGGFIRPYGFMLPLSALSKRDEVVKGSVRHSTHWPPGRETVVCRDCALLSCHRLIN